MRNPERISRVLKEIELLWNNYPDWRLGQLIFNIVGRDPFHIEDYDLIEQGFEKFGKGNTVPIISEFPDYWIDPNSWKITFHDSLQETKNEVETDE